MYYEQDTKKTDREAMITKWLPRVSLIIAICAFVFQVTVLYPWHLDLSAQFAELAKAVKNSK